MVGQGRSGSGSLEAGAGSGTELGDYLLSREETEKSNNNSLSGLLTRLGEGMKKVVPKRIGGTGSVEDDISVRFGLFGSGGNGTNTPTSTTGSSWFSGCGYNMVRNLRVGLEQRGPEKYF
jgi:hypothetical protein